MNSENSTETPFDSSEVPTGDSSLAPSDSEPQSESAQSMAQVTAPVDSVAGAEPLAISSEFYRLDPRQIQADLLVGMIFSAIVAVAALVGIVVAWFQLGLSLWLYVILGGAFLVVLCLFLISWFWPYLEFNRTSYRIDQEGLEIRRGVFWRHSITIPLGRVQHADVSQGPIQRMYGIGTLTVHTAGTHNASIQIDGLEYQHAVAVRDFIVHQRKERDAV